MKSTKRLVIKIGSNVLAKSNEELDVSRIKKLTEQISELHSMGIEVILVSSGAVASGRTLLQLSDKMDVVSKRQILASVGQVKLLNIYSELFGKEGLLCAQVLVTKEDFRDREHYLNMKNCINALLQNKVIPVINENDVISVTELMFTDNDELAGLVSGMADAAKLIILSNVDGIYNGSPNDPASKVIPEIAYGHTDAAEFVTTEKSNFGRGGMMTKFTMAQKVAGLGIPVHIANGKKDKILLDIINNKAVGTIFTPKKNASSIKKWVAHSEGFTKAVIFIDAGAEKALASEKPTSLLPVGVIKIEGEFKKGDLLKICNKSGKQIGVGRAQYNSEKARTSMRKKNEKALVHYDYLFLNIE